MNKIKIAIPIILLIFAAVTGLLIFNWADSNGENGDGNDIFYQARGLDYAGQYYSLQRLIVWGDFAYVLALDSQVYDNGINWILTLDSEGQKTNEISYKTEIILEENRQSSSDIVDIAVDSHGNIWALEATGEFLVGAENYVMNAMQYRLICFDERGDIRETYGLADINRIGGDAPIVQRFLIDAEDDFYLLCDASASSADRVFVYSGQGEYIDCLDGDIDALALDDGRVVALITSHLPGGDKALYAVDKGSWSWGESTPASSDIRYVYEGQSHDLLLNNGSYLYGYTWGEETPRELLNWVDSDINNGFISSLGEFSNGNLIALSSDGISLQTDILLLEPVSSDLANNYTTITLATTAPNDILKNQVIRFNQSHTDYKISIIDYTIYDTVEDTYGGDKQFVTDILSGEIPDIIDFYSLPIDPLISAGYLEDLYPWLEQDPDIGAEDFLSSLLRALDVDGALYRLPNRFYFTFIAGDRDVLGEKQGWTIDDMYALMDTYPQYQSALNTMCTQTDFLGLVMRYCAWDYIDLSNGTSSFLSDDFLSLLRFTKDYFPAEGQLLVEDQLEGLGLGYYPLVYGVAFNIGDIVLYNDSLGGGANFIGLPTGEGIGNAFVPCENFGITTTSAHKDMAWEFIRGFLLDEVEDADLIYFFPALMSQLERTTEINTEIYAMGYEDERFSQEDVELFWSLLGSIDRVAQYDNSIREIVLEEAVYYLRDDKSAEDVADIIQNRVQTLLNE